MAKFAIMINKRFCQSFSNTQWAQSSPNACFFKGITDWILSSANCLCGVSLSSPKNRPVDALSKINIPSMSSKCAIVCAVSCDRQISHPGYIIALCHFNRNTCVHASSYGSSKMHQSNDPDKSQELYFMLTSGQIWAFGWRVWQYDIFPCCVFVLRHKTITSHTDFVLEGLQTDRLWAVIVLLITEYLNKYR